MQIYDAAQTTAQNERHWANADGRGPLSANDPATRQKLRDRSRYEQQNNGYLRGAVRTKVGDDVGRKGPRFRFAFDDADANKFLNREFARWLKAIGFRRKLKTFIRAFIGDGEAIAVMTTNPKLPTQVKLDFRGVEAEQLTSPATAYGSRGKVKDRSGQVATYVTDGILYDAAGNPIEYHVLKNHPGDCYALDPFAFDALPAESVIHCFEVERFGQVRGIPQTSTGLPLGAIGRRYTLATAQTAENQANFTGVLETDGSGDPDDPPESIPEMQVERGTLATLPDKHKLHAFDPSQPATNYPQFKREVLSEIGRPLGMPYNVIACDSSSHNYSSARLDTQEYQDEVADERSDIEEGCLDRLKDAWLTEALLIPGYVPFGLTYDGGIPFEAGEDGVWRAAPGAWFYSGWGYIDPVKEVTAIQLRLENHLTTLQAEHAKNGDDWKEIIDQRAAEIAYLKEKGIPLAAALPSPTDPNHPANQPEPAPEPPVKRAAVGSGSRQRNAFSCRPPLPTATDTEALCLR